MVFILNKHLKKKKKLFIALKNFYGIMLPIVSIYKQIGVSQKDMLKI